MAQETGPITGTKDEDYNIIGFTEACLNNVLRLETSGRPPLCRAIPAGKRQALATMRKPAFLHGCQRRIRSKMPWPCGLGVFGTNPRSEKPWTKRLATSSSTSIPATATSRPPSRPRREPASRVEASESKREPARLDRRAGADRRRGPHRCSTPRYVPKHTTPSRSQLAQPRVAGGCTARGARLDVLQRLSTTRLGRIRRRR